MTEKRLPMLEWPDIPHTVESLLSALSESSGIDKLLTCTIHLRSPADQYKKGDTPEGISALPYRPRPDVAELVLQFPMDWMADPFKDPNWCSSLNSCRFLDRSFICYERTGDPEFLSFPKKVVLDWYAFHIHAENGEHAFAIDDMAVGVRAARFAYFADKVRSGKVQVTPEELRKIAEVLLFHWQLFMREGYFKFNNHTVSALHGFMALVQVACLPVTVRSDWFRAFSFVFTELVNRQFDDAGIHYENSPEYHFFALRLFSELLRSGWYDEVEGTFHHRLELARQHAPWMRFPDGRVLPIGDTTAAAPPRPGLLQPRDFPVPPEVLNHPRYHISKFIAEDGWSLLAIKAGYQQKTHRHEDNLSFVWSESGHDIIVDPAKYAYARDPVRAYVMSARAHNIIDFVCNGKSAKACESNRLPDVARRDGYLEIRLQVMMVEPSAFVERRVFLVPGRALLVIDEFRCDGADSFASRTHFASDFLLDLSDGVVATDDRGAKVRTAIFASTPIQIAVNRGIEKPRLEGWISRGYKQIAPCSTLVVSGSANTGLIATGHAIDVPIALTRETDMLVWTFGDRKIEIML